MGLIILLFSNYKDLQKSLHLESPGAFPLFVLNRKKINEMLVLGEFRAVRPPCVSWVVPWAE